MSAKKYYSVTCKCVHTGSRMNYIPIVFPIIAENGKEAAAIARNFPRCKHNHKDCILGVEKIDFEEYKRLYLLNKQDPYLHCSSIQEQKQFDISDRFVPDPRYYSKRETCDKEEQKHQNYHGKTKIRNPKKFARYYDTERIYA